MVVAYLAASEGLVDPLALDQKQIQPVAKARPGRSGGDVHRPTVAASLGDCDGGADTKRRKVYLCGRCGAPKRGHVCTVPEQQPKVEVTETPAASIPVLQVRPTYQCMTVCCRDQPRTRVRTGSVPLGA